MIYNPFKYISILVKSIKIIKRFYFKSSILIIVIFICLHCNVSILEASNDFENLFKIIKKDAERITDKSFQFYYKNLIEDINDKNEGGIATDISNLANFYLRKGKSELALKLYQKALCLYKKISNRRGIAIIKNRIGMINSSLGSHNKAIENFKDGLKISRDIGDLELECAVLNNLGAVYASLDKYEESIEFYNESIKISQKIGDLRREGITLANIGDAYASDYINDADKAIEFYKKSLRIFEEAAFFNDAEMVRNKINKIEPPIKKWLMASQIGGFTPSSSIKKRYGNGLGFFGGIGIKYNISHKFSIAGDLGYWKTEKKEDLEIENSIEAYFLTLTIIYNILDKGKVTSHVSVGPGLYSAIKKEKDLFTESKSTPNPVVGFQSEVGINYSIFQYISTNLVIRYSFIKISEWDDINIGGFTIRIGIGFQF